MSTYSIGQMNQLGDALELAGFTPDEVTKLRNSRLLPKVRKVILGHAEIVIPEHVIDCDAEPFIPEGWSVKEHRKGSAFKWGPAAVALYLSEGQKNGKVIEGNKLREELANKPILNANVLDYLLANSHLIPEEWKGKAVFFWGTIYRGRGGRLYIRYLSWYGGRWYWRAVWLGFVWNDDCPAAVLANPPTEASA